MFNLQILVKREPTSGLEPLTCSLRVSLSPTPYPSQIRHFAGDSLAQLFVPLRRISPCIAPTAATTARRPAAPRSLTAVGATSMMRAAFPCEVGVLRPCFQANSLLSPG